MSETNQTNSISPSLWRKKANFYFGEQNSYVQNSVIERLKVPQFISPDSTVPLSFYLDKQGQVSLFSLDSFYRFNDLGSAKINVNDITSFVSAKDKLLVGNGSRVTLFTTNASSAAKAQNIDDFMQMALPSQEQPKDLGPPVAQFFCCDTQVSSWAQPEFSILPMAEYKKDEKTAQRAVTKYYQKCKAETPFQIQESFVFDHKTENDRLNFNKAPSPPLSGIILPLVRKISYNFKDPSTFYSICGKNWFVWDLKSQKLKTSGNGGVYQLMDIDASPILKDTFAVSTFGGNVNLIDLRAKDNIQRVFSTDDMMPITKVKFSPIVQPLLATTSGDFNVKLWDIRASFDKPFLVLKGHTHEISSIQFSHHRPDFVFTSSYDSTVRIWNINNQYPPHNCLHTLAPSPGAKVINMVAGFHRTDSFYYSCSDGRTGVVELRPELFKPIIPHRLKTEEDQEAEELLYFKRNQLLLAKILPKINSVFEKKEDVTPIFPLLDLARSVPYDLNQAKLNNATMKEIIAHYSYFNSLAIPTQLIQSPEPQQMTDAYRTALFAKVIGGIQKKDYQALIVEKRNLINILDAFQREQILGIVQTIALASFEEAIEVGMSYLERLVQINKVEKFFDVGYFLFYPTIYDDPAQKFVPYSQKGVDEKTRYKPIFDNTRKIQDELKDLQFIIATASNDLKNSQQDIFKKLQKYDSFVSLYLTRCFLSAAFALQHWATCIIRAASIQKEFSAFPIKKVILDWIDNEVVPGFIASISKRILDPKTTDFAYTSAIADVIVIGIGSEELSPLFESKYVEVFRYVKESAEKVIGNPETCKKMFGKSASEIAQMVQKRISEIKIASSQKSFARCRNAHSLEAIINNIASKP